MLWSNGKTTGFDPVDSCSIQDSTAIFHKGLLMSYFYLTYENDIHNIIQKTTIEHSVKGKIFSWNMNHDNDEYSLEFFINGYEYKNFYKEFGKDEISGVPNYVINRVSETLDNKYYEVLEKEKEKKKLRCRKPFKSRRRISHGRK